MKKLIVAKNIGFCFGVNRTVKMACSLLDDKKNLYSSGDIVHNPVVMEELKTKGLRVNADMQKIENVPFIIRSHGMGQKSIRRLKNKGIEIHDATCPSVKKLHSLIKKLDKEKYFVIIIGNKEHPEVKALRDYGKKTVVLQEKMELDNFASQEKIAVIGQTTLSFRDYFKTAGILLDRLPCKKFVIYNTICKVTEERQTESAEISRKCDMVMVLGGKTSSNTGKLYQNCLRYNGKVHLVEKLEELDGISFNGIFSVGIVSGTSTPENFITAVKKCLKNKGYKEV